MRYELCRRRGAAPTVEALKNSLYRWETNFNVPNEANRRLLALVLDVTVAELGMTEDPDFVW
ncbi:hypothetical protein [Actinoplanes sp. NPDC051859]|uniref:hypothetical protein n=1 Tax=Actinoplanes sp. NPDC051859 TaxID=3363909 RepID=UPI00378DC3BD